MDDEKAVDEWAALYHGELRQRIRAESERDAARAKLTEANGRIAMLRARVWRASDRRAIPTDDAAAGICAALKGD